MTDRKIDLAIVGATTQLGEALLELLEEREYPVGRLSLLGGEDVAGQRLSFTGKNLKVEFVEEFDFSKSQLTIFAGSAEISAEYAPQAAEAGSLVIDTSHFFRYEVDVPLVIAEVNPERIKDIHQRGIVASPDPLATQMLLTLNPIDEEVGIERINVTTFQAVSVEGQAGVEALAGQTARLLNGKKVTASTFEKQVAFNVLPQHGQLMDNGYTQEEMKLVLEARKIFQNETLGVNVTSTVVPVFFGHSMAVQIETQEKLSVDQAVALMETVPNLEIISAVDGGAFPTPVSDSAEALKTFVGRVREDISCPKGLNLWIVADNVRKSAAFNTIQIAELLEKSYL